jgi:glycosyltransferase involved in cell wall biosynthesis
MKQPSLSILMNNYNDAKVMKRQLDSVFEQSELLHEVIIVDDGSTDNSMEIFNEYKVKYPKLRIVENGQNKGIMYSANKGLELATGDFIYWAAMDDWIQPGFVKGILSALSLYPDVNLCCFDSAVFDDGSDEIQVNRLLPVEKVLKFSSEEIADVILEKDFIIVGHASVVRREAMLKAGGLLPELKWYCDWFAQYVVAFRGSVSYIPKALTALRLDPKSYSGSINNASGEKQTVIYQMMKYLFSEKYKDAIPFFTRSQLFFKVFGRQALRVIRKNKEFKQLVVKGSAQIIWMNSIKSSLGCICPSWLKSFLKSLRTKIRVLKFNRNLLKKGI